MSHSIEESRARNPMWVYEQNFRLMAGMFPVLLSGEQESVSVRTRAHELELKIVEFCRYTLTVRICHRFGPDADCVSDFNMTVRVYNDARLVEVQDYLDSGKLLPEYPRNNTRMFHRDEKSQANRLLWDWLQQINASCKPLVLEQLADA